MTIQDDIKRFSDRIGFEFMDFIGYFVPGAIFICTTFFTLELYCIFAYSDLDFCSAFKDSLSYSYESGIALFNIIIFVIFSYVIGNVFCLVRWQIIKKIANDKLSADIKIEPELHPFLTEEQRNDKDLVLSSKRHCELKDQYHRARNKFMVDYLTYHAISYRLYSLAAFRWNMAIAIKYLGIVNGILALLWIFCLVVFKQYPGGMLSNMLIWAFISTIVYLMVYIVLNKDRYEMHQDYYEKVSIVSEWP